MFPVTFIKQNVEISLDLNAKEYNSLKLLINRYPHSVLNSEFELTLNYLRVTIKKLREKGKGIFEIHSSYGRSYTLFLNSGVSVRI